MKIVYLLVFVLLVGFKSNYLAAKDLQGKDLFYNFKGKYGSCNYCHKNGGSAGKWDFETEEINTEEGKKIPSLKGIGKRKDEDQIKRSIQLMKKMFGFKLTDEQISQLAEYVGTL